MHTIRLRINDKVYERFIWLLSKFNKEEVEIISDDQDFMENQRYLKQELDEIESGKAIFYSQDELENRLDKLNDKHEDYL